MLYLGAKCVAHWGIYEFFYLSEFSVYASDILEISLVTCDKLALRFACLDEKIILLWVVQKCI
ncbi:hypothetical protein HNQ69_000048 [Bartonella callosciuri]|uniref:Uncharacterized protein n=1 Tax=Bartonella callosciuri TaxID=686223 RepID=A0A840NN07_9HYPH|nr:hypothetical protein [Bartonella callosciuri]